MIRYPQLFKLKLMLVKSFNVIGKKEFMKFGFMYLIFMIKNDVRINLLRELYYEAHL